MDVCGCREEPKRCSHQCKPTSVVLDIQCFKNDENEFILKEVCIIEVVTGILLLHHIAISPYSQRFLSQEKLRESCWLTKHYHGLEWNKGDIGYHTLIQKVRTCLSDYSTVYVKGLEKKQYVLNTLVTDETSLVVDMSDIGCSSLASISGSSTIRCNHHKSVQNHCALANCTSLRHWLIHTDNNSYESCCCC